MRQIVQENKKTPGHKYLAADVSDALHTKDRDTYPLRGLLFAT